MFTGLVEARGTVDALVPEGSAVRLRIAVPVDIADGCAIGDSVAINGCCLTVIGIEGPLWTFEAGAETLSKTNLGRLRVGDAVNLERPLPAGGRLGGHFVQGHVDGTGEVLAIERDGEWVTMWFRVPESLAAQMVPKGSVTVDGVSLTIVAVERDRFSIALIPHTLAVTTLGFRGVGDAVNIETDILGKYVQKFLAAGSI
jgi:riboflavin synthase